jgi:hypothetical protein
MIYNIDDLVPTIQRDVSQLVEFMEDFPSIFSKENWKDEPMLMWNMEKDLRLVAQAPISFTANTFTERANHIYNFFFAKIEVCLVPFTGKKGKRLREIPKELELDLKLMTTVRFENSLIGILLDNNYTSTRVFNKFLRDLRDSIEKWISMNEK